MLFIDRVTELLSDGEWHYVNALVRELGGSEERMRGVLEFCEEFSIAVFNVSGNQVRIDDKFGVLFE